MAEARITIGIARETAPGERRVALTPETAKKLVAAGSRVMIERGAGFASGFVDDAYAQAGAEPVADAAAALGEADLVLCVQPPAAEIGRASCRERVCQYV